MHLFSSGHPFIQPFIQSESFFRTSGHMLRTIRWRLCAVYDKTYTSANNCDIMLYMEGVINYASFSWGDFSLFSYWDFVSYPVSPANLIFSVSSFSLDWPLSVPKSNFPFSEQSAPTWPWIAHFLQLNELACFLHSNISDCHLLLRNLPKGYKVWPLSLWFYLLGTMLSKVGTGVPVDWACLSVSSQVHLSLLSHSGTFPA